jgi:hypothetical protein
VEIAIPRQAIGDPASLKLVMIGDNLSIGGGVEDVVPDGTYDSSAAIRYLSYNTNGDASEPVLLPAVDESLEALSGRQALLTNAIDIRRQAEPQAEVRTGGGVPGVAGPAALLFCLLWLRRRRAVQHRGMVL